THAPAPSPAAAEQTAPPEPSAATEPATPAEPAPSAEHAASTEPASSMEHAASAEPASSREHAPSAHHPSSATPAPTRDDAAASSSEQPDPGATITMPSSEVPILERPLDALFGLPTRTLNWAEQNDVRTIRDLVAVHPDVFAQQRNIGRGSLRETRTALETALGQEWEEAWHALPPPKQGPPELEAEETSVDADASAANDGPVRWDTALATIPEKLRAAPLDEVDLPSRMRSYCEQHQITTIEQLLSIPAQRLLEAKNLGRTSLRTTLAALRDYVEMVEHTPEDPSFLEGWKRRLHALEPLLRLVITRRAGVTGAPEKLESLGEMLGVTRERVRQLEVSALESLARQRRWLSGIHAGLSTAFAGTRSVPLELLEEDPWWHGISQHLA